MLHLACHSREVTPADTDWVAMAAYYEALSFVTPSPIVAMNHAVSVGMAFGPA